MDKQPEQQLSARLPHLLIDTYTKRAYDVDLAIYPGSLVLKRLESWTDPRFGLLRCSVIGPAQIVGERVTCAQPANQTAEHGTEGTSESDGEFAKTWFVIFKLGTCDTRKFEQAAPFSSPPDNTENFSYLDGHSHTMTIQLRLPS